MKEVEHHLDWYYPIENMRTLILGTFPPHKDKWDYPFYYPNKANNFWKVLANIAGTTLNYHSGEAAVLERKALMQNLRVGVQNLGLVVERRGKGALDKDISILEYQDLIGIITTSESLNKIFLPGYSDKTSTYKSFVDYLKKNGINYSLPEKIKAGFEFSIDLNRPITCVIGNSTSGTAQLGGVTFDMLVQQFRKAIVD